jgi:hypothetical protein
MVIRAEVGDRPDVGVLVVGIGLAGIVVGPVSHVVDPIGLIGFAVGVDHGSVGPSTGEALFLGLSLFVAVPADDVGVGGVAVTDLAIVVSWAGVVPRRESGRCGTEVRRLAQFLAWLVLPR